MSEFDLPGTQQLSWQYLIDGRLQKRLMRPLEKPGLINTSVLEGAIISRSHRLSDRLPLLAQMERRWSSVRSQSANEIPLVYAQSSPSQDCSDRTAIAAAGTSGTNLQLFYAHPLPIPDSSGEKFSLSKPSSIPKRPGDEVPIIQAKFAPSSESSLINKLPQKSSELMNAVREDPPEFLVYMGSGSRDSENILRGNQSDSPTNLNVPVAGSPISYLESPVVQAKLELPTQSVDRVSSLSQSVNLKPEEATNRVSNPSQSIDRQPGEVTVPVVKVTRDSNFEPTEPSPFLFNPITVERTLTNKSDGSTVKHISHVSLTPNILSIPGENLGGETPKITGGNSPQFVRPNRGDNWKGLDLQLLWFIPPSSNRTGAASRSQDLATQPYNLGEKAEYRKASEVAIATSVAHPVANVSESSLPTTVPGMTDIQRSPASPERTSSSTPIDLDSLADKVERKLMRRIAIESERRGQKRWR